MARYLSEDLRVRVIEAVRSGASRRQAAARFGVSVSSAIHWVAEWRASDRTAHAAEQERPDVRARRLACLRCRHRR